eukprot:1438746-Pyramimonas_sp.AAC.1
MSTRRYGGPRVDVRYYHGNPLCEVAPLLVKDASDPEPTAGTPAVRDAHAYMMSQDKQGIRFSINEETFAFTSQSLVNNTSRTWHRRNASFGATPTSADRDFALHNLQANIYQAIHEGEEMDSS